MEHKTSISASKIAAEPVQIPYRRDIDGLRALAVSAVLLYHFNITGIHGGFCGVDVFFVISGVVIANSIISDTLKDNFSISNFYFKRVRRILPAYAVVITLTSIFAYMFLLPPDLVDFSKSMSASSAFV